MPRCARRQSTSNIYHVMVRGNERKNIFLDDEDRNRFVDTLQNMKGEDNFDIYAYCLMLSMLSDNEDKAIGLFKEFTKEAVEDKFVEYSDSVKISNDKNMPMGLRNEIIKRLAEHGQTLDSFKDCRDKPLRNRLLKEIKEATNASVRDISRVMGISKDIIFRA